MTAERQRDLLAFLSIACLGILVLLLRNPDPLLRPALYGEDSFWAYQLLNDRYAAYLHPRYDYLVLGQTLMLDLAMRSSLLATGGTLAFLPQAIALISYAFWAGFAAIAYLALARWMTVPWRLAVVAAILLLPLGLTMNEVVGRILNLGYLFLPLAFMLCLLRERRIGRPAAAALVAGLAVCIFTNPIVVAVVGAHLALRAVRRIVRREPLPWLGDIVLAIAILAFCALFVARLGEGPQVPGSTLDWDRLVEMAGARSLLFPFVFGFYESLSDAIVRAILLAVAALVTTAIIFSPPRQKLFGLCLVAITLGSVLITVATRPFLTGILDDYGTTFPDRYYMAQNVLAFVTIAWALSRLPRVVQAVGALTILVCVGLGAGQLFEFGRPEMVIATDGTFADQVAAALERSPGVTGDAPLIVDAYPAGWSLAIPATLAFATAEATAHARSPEAVDRIDLAALPYQWGAQAASPAAAGTTLSLETPFRSALTKDLQDDNGFLRSTGRDPYLVLDLSGVPESAGNTPLLSFDFTCENRTRFVEMQVFWATPDQPAMKEARSLLFLAGPGRNVVPLDAHPSFSSADAVAGLRLDIVRPRACSGFRFDDIRLGRRS